MTTVSDEEKIKEWLKTHKVTRVKKSLSGSPQKLDQSRADKYLKKRKRYVPPVTGTN